MNITEIMKGNCKLLLPHQFYYPMLRTTADRAKTDTIHSFIYSLNHEDPTSGKEVVLYIHIPFCDSHCLFCSFDKCYDLTEKSKYLTYIMNEMKQYAAYPYIQKLKIKAIHFGGGTPSLLTGKELEYLIRQIYAIFKTEQPVTINMEGSANTLTREDILEFLSGEFISRVSVGVQSFHPKIREFYHANSKLSEVYYALEQLQKRKIHTYTDIMYGYPSIPNVNEYDRIMNDISFAASFDVDGIEFGQLYPYHNGIEKLDNLKFPMSDELEHMILDASDRMESLGYHQETEYGFVRNSNIILENAYYGNGDHTIDCIGIGSGSWGQLCGYKYRNYPFGLYMDQKKTPYVHMKKLTAREMACQSIVGFPKRLYLSKQALNGHPEQARFFKTLHLLQEYDMIEDNKEFYCLTKRGKCYIDNIYFAMLSEEEQNIVTNELQIQGISFVSSYN